jgi:pimeloyl-ACP methyl ester carboxylesterase
MENKNSKTILFIHGAFVNHNCWDDWAVYFRNKGYNVEVEPWPYKNAPADILRRRQPDPQIASLRLRDLLGHYSDVITSMHERPILIGHSYGGLLTQLLLNQGLAAAGVAIHSVPPQGIIPLNFSFYKSTFGPLGFFTSVNKTFLFNLKQWQYSFTNGMPLDVQKSTFNQLVVPESKRVSRDALSKTARIDFKKPHNPLLIMAGTDDQIMPADVNRMNYKKYKKNGSVIDFIEFKRNHFVLGQPGWQENADYIHEWLKRNVD